MNETAQLRADLNAARLALGVVVEQATALLDAVDAVSVLELECISSPDKTSRIWRASGRLSDALAAVSADQGRAGSQLDPSSWGPRALWERLQAAEKVCEMYEDYLNGKLLASGSLTMAVDEWRSLVRGGRQGEKKQ